MRNASLDCCSVVYPSKHPREQQNEGDLLERPIPWYSTAMHFNQARSQAWSHNRFHGQYSESLKVMVQTEEVLREVCQNLPVDDIAHGRTSRNFLCCIRSDGSANHSSSVDISVSSPVQVETGCKLKMPHSDSAVCRA